MNRRATHIPSRQETAYWVLARVCVVEALLIVCLVFDLMIPVGVR